MTMGTPDGPHSRFLGFVTIPCTEQSHGELKTHHPCACACVGVEAGARSDDPTMTEHGI